MTAAPNRPLPWIPSGGGGTRDGPWLAWLCLGRAGFALIVSAYSAVLPVLQKDWDMSAGQAGSIQSAWQVGYLVSLFLAGFLSDRYGAKRTYLAMSYASCAGVLLYAFFADSFLSGLLLYGLAGLCSGGSYTPGLALIAERFPPARRGRAMGYYLAAASFGYAVSLLVAGLLIPVSGWRTVMLFAAAGTVAGTLIAAAVLRDTPNLVRHRHGGAAPRRSLPMVWRNKPAMLAVWAYSFHAWELLGMWAWLPAFLAASVAGNGHPSLAAVGLGTLLAAASHLMSTFGNIAGGSLSDRLGRTAVMMLMSCVSLACSLAFGWLFATPLWVLTLVAMVYCFTAVADSSVYSTALTELVPPDFLGAAYSLRSVLGFGLGAISPWLFGLVLDAAAAHAGERSVFAWGLAWSFLGLGGLLGPWCIARLRAMDEAAAMASGRK